MSKGIYFNNQYNKYRARLYYKGKYFHVGRFDTLEEAYEAREKAAKRFMLNNLESL